MSHVRAENIGRPGGQAIPMNTVLQGTAKAWFNLNGTGVIAPRDDFNVSSYVDNGVGDYTANFATAMPNANYVGNFLLRFDNGSGVSNAIASQKRGGLLTTTQFDCVAHNVSFTPVDMDRVLCAIHGDPA